MSFSEELVRLMRLVDSGIPVPAAAVAVGISKGRAYELLKAAGRGRGPKTTISDEHRRVVIGEFDRTGSINQAAIRSGLSHNAARRILVAAGLVAAVPVAVGKPDAKARFLELIKEAGRPPVLPVRSVCTRAPHGIGVGGSRRPATRGYTPTGRSWTTAAEPDI